MQRLRASVLTMRDWFAEAFGSAVSDIRQKLIDEAWFGRRPVSPADSREGRGEDDRVGERDAQSHDFGIDR